MRRSDVLQLASVPWAVCRLTKNSRGMVSAILIPAAVMALALGAGPLALADSAEALFLAHCSSCHGAIGEGGRGPRLNVPRLLKAPDDAALSAVITNGVPGGAMPGTRMTPEENRQLVAYVRKLGHAEAVESPGQPAKRRESVLEQGQLRSVPYGRPPWPASGPGPHGDRSSAGSLPT